MQRGYGGSSGNIDHYIPNQSATTVLQILLKNFSGSQSQDCGFYYYLVLSIPHNAVNGPVQTMCFQAIQAERDGDGSSTYSL